MASTLARLSLLGPCLLLLAACGGGTPGPALDTVESVDLERYAGRWYQIALIPNRFQDQCVRNTTAEYGLRADGRLDVTNRCLRADGSADSAEGIARVVDPDSKARLEVSFVSLLGLELFWGDYWIIDLDPDYQHVVVGTPSRRYGWILAREPQLPTATLDRLKAVLADQGYDPERFETSPQQWP
jgi:apolipoprotein D and lipocalin family protein